MITNPMALLGILQRSDCYQACLKTRNSYYAASVADALTPGSSARSARTCWRAR